MSGGKAESLSYSVDADLSVEDAIREGIRRIDAASQRRVPGSIGHIVLDDAVPTCGPNANTGPAAPPLNRRQRRARFALYKKAVKRGAKPI